MLVSERLQQAVGVALVLLLGGALGLLVRASRHPLTTGYRLHVDFARVENLKEGVDVRLSGRRLGRVLAVRRSIPGETPPPLGPVRVTVWIERAQGQLFWRNAQVYLNSVGGVIGERYLEVGPPAGAPEAPAAPESALRGIDPPVLDRLLNESFRTMNLALRILKEEAPSLRTIGSGMAHIRKLLAETGVNEAPGRLKARVVTLLDELRGLENAFNQATEGGRAVTRLRGRVERLVDGHGPQVRTLVRRAERLSTAVGELEQLVDPRKKALVAAFERLDRAATLAKAMTRQIAALMARVERGEGSLARLAKDPELVDDFKESQRTIRETPWKVLGKPPRERAPRGAPKR
ncbi:MAG: MCE family protein [Deltaproteobacteria bacterium]|nr:MCE family protein [Deltaproteobacteria bacterium]